MHEIRRSPYASPSRSLWRSSKCLKNKRLRMARRSIWTRAKHRVGLERPHFCTRFRGQSDRRGRSSPRGDSFRCFARVCRRVLRRNMYRKRVNKVKAVRITLCTFRTVTSSPNARPTKFILKRLPTIASAKVTAQKRANPPGAPHFLGEDPPKGFLGSLPRSYALRVGELRGNCAGQSFVRHDV